MPALLHSRSSDQERRVSQGGRLFRIYRKTLCQNRWDRCGVRYHHRFWHGQQDAPHSHPERPWFHETDQSWGDKLYFKESSFNLLTILLMRTILIPGPRVARNHSWPGQRYNHVGGGGRQVPCLRGPGNQQKGDSRGVDCLCLRLIRLFQTWTFLHFIHRIQLISAHVLFHATGTTVMKFTLKTQGIYI